jgi:hypothetical protein
MSPFTDTPQPQRRMWASARALRDHKRTFHVRIQDASEGRDYAIAVTAVLRQESGGYADETEDIYRRTIDAAAANKLTVARPTLSAGFAPPKYNYMSGYLWMIAMSILGYIVTLYFTRREEKGLIHKRGREESEVEAEAEKQNEALVKAGGEDHTHYYTPGYVPAKIGIICLGLVFITLGMVQLGPKLTLFVKGNPAQAVATRIAKEKIGGERVWFEHDADVLAAKENYDRSFVFWNEYAFSLPDSTVKAFVAPAGKQLEPVHMILDKDGLPHVARIWYDPDNPDRVMLPFVWSTWFLPGLLTLFGLIGISIGGCLLYHARKPIAMPLLPPEAVKD